MIVFERPIWLLLLLLIVPSFLLTLRSIGGLSRTKALVSFSVRTLVILLLATALSNPSWEERGEGVTATILLDRSLSVPYRLKKESVEFLALAAEAKSKQKSDRVAVITIAKDATINAMPDEYTMVAANMEPADLAATNLAEGVNTALSIMPDDTANRIILASDGNETEGLVLEAAQLASANGVPVDVILLEYEHAGEVIFERLVAPPQVRQGQSANVKLVLRSQTTTAGTLYLRLNGEPLDLDPEAPGNGRRVELSPGPFVLPVTVSMDQPGPQEFEAFLEVEGADDLPENNRAMAVTFVGSEGRVLVIRDSPAESEYLVRALRQSRIAVDEVAPDAMPPGLVFLSGYDAIALANLPRWVFDEDQDRMLHAYVHDLGGGLIMLGGPNAFGAGGWIDSETAKALPVELDPPSIQQMPRGALALIMHSCEMPQGNFWGQKVAESAIEALSRLDYVGIVEFNWAGGVGGIAGCSWAFPMQLAGDKQAALAATKKMVVGDMPAFDPSMQLALQGLTTQAARAAQKHVIIISDGDPSPPTQGLIDKYKASRVTVTTVMVGGHGTNMDKAKMNKVATDTGGRFYEVKNPKNLPSIFIKEAQLVSRSLIQEGDIYQPQVVSRLPGPIEGFAAVPAIDGYVLTHPRTGLAQTPIVIPTSEGRDPIYAYWNFGLGKSVAFTSDVQGRWGTRWLGWAEFKAFWEQTVRWAMRPGAPSNILLDTRMEGDRAIVELEALDVDASFLNFLQTRAVTVAPDGSASPLSLQQTGPGRYRGEFAVDEPGAYLVNVNYAGGGADAPAAGNLQAAVNVPYSREFRTVKHNAALLRELAERTGGRVLDWNSPELAEVVDLFHRENLELPRSYKRIWDLLIMIAAGLFVLDVAARRLAIDAKWLRGLAGRAVSSRGEASTDTVAAWKRTKQQVVRARGDVTTRKEQAARAKARFEADESDRAKAIDVGGDSPRDLRQPSATERAPEAPPETAGEDEDYTSRLLKAKRRARGDDEGAGDGADA
ncbi:MAG: VWA domain-containing protein [Planctomycetota bacterium]|jgi:uncharacterized membrane protein